LQQRYSISVIVANEPLVIEQRNLKSLTVIDEGEKGLLDEEMRIEDD